MNIEVWEAMADQFLDTETRADVPHVAWLCVQAGLTTEAAFDIWAYEVTPAVWPNLWDVAGEWAGWDRDWLVARIERRRAKPSTLRYMQYRCRVHGGHASWLGIAACMRVLYATAPEQRAQLALDLGRLAAAYFDMTFREHASRDLRALYVETFEPIFERLVVPSKTESKTICRARISRLGMAT